MPTYEYFCETCEREFELIITLREHDEITILCPNCGSDKVHQLAAVFTPVTTKKS